MDHQVAAKIRVAELLDALLNEGRVLTLGRDATLDYSGSCTDPIKPRHAASSSLIGLMDGLGANPRLKVCLRCEVAKRIGGYGPDRDSADGLAAVCKACEAKRIGAIGKRKKGRT